jgi:hypothetical protein
MAGSIINSFFLRQPLIRMQAVNLPEWPTQGDDATSLIYQPRILKRYEEFKRMV